MYGRDEELTLLDGTLASARAGRGRALFFTGEPGIGKSTLLSEARTRTDGLVLSGAAWESGGAPSYWPWLQVLRDAADAVGTPVRQLPGAERIASLVPAWGPAATEDALDPASARFALLDAVVRALVALGTEQSITIVLDDLHAADVPSLDLLVLLMRELPRTRIAVVAAWREAELAVRADVAQRLSRASRGGTVQALRRLTADEVTAWVGGDGATVYATTEGNPLFVEEVLRARRGGATHGMTSVIADHLALASEPTRRVLATASVLGREIEVGMLGPLTAQGADSIEAALREATAVGIVEQHGRAPRFRHILLRDQLYASMPPSLRLALHRRAGELLEPVDPVRAAHHLLTGLAGEDVARAVAAARRGAARASNVYAFEQAAELLGAALAAVEHTPLAQDETTIDLRIELAEANHHLGRAEQARAGCVTAAEQARARGDIVRLARAAMVYAAELTSGTRDAVMVALLDEVRSKLSADDSATLARVTARLAAALVPGPDPDAMRAQQLARDAVAMARRLGDKETIMFALRYAAHAQAYQISVEEALELSREMVSLADELGRPLEGLDHRAWLVGGNLAVGDLAAAELALERFEALLAPLPQPHYRWRLPLVRAAWATRRGDFEEAERHIAIVSELAREYDLDRATWATMFARLGLVVATRDRRRAQQLLPDIRAARRMGPIAGNFIGLVEAIAGNHAEALAELTRTHFIPALIVVQFSADAIVRVGARSLAERMLPFLESQVRLHPMVHGPQSSLMARPSALVLGDLYLLLDRVEDAIEWLERGLALARKIDAMPFVAMGAASLAVALERRGQPDETRVAALREEADRVARLCGIDPVVLVAGAPAHPTAAPAQPAPAAVAERGDGGLSIACDGERARIRWRGRTFAVPAAKGFDFLAVLVAAAGTEIHVSDLVGDDDRGDAGEVLDARARSAYRDRATELQRELEEARARNDLGRIERLGAELEAISDELLAATGLGGRARKAGSRVERARVNVQRRIKDAIRRLGAEDEALGRYLDATVRTGTYCSFVPIDS